MIDLVKVEDNGMVGELHCFFIQDDKGIVKFWPESLEISFKCSIVTAYRMCKIAWRNNNILRQYQFIFKSYENRLLSLPHGTVVFHGIELSTNHKRI